MAEDLSSGPAQRKHRSGHRSRRERLKVDSPHTSTVSSEEKVGELDVETIRQARADYYSTPPEDRRKLRSPQMPEDGERKRRSNVRSRSRAGPPSTRREVEREDHPRPSHRRRRTKRVEEDDTVYVYSSGARGKERRSTASLPPSRRQVVERSASSGPEIVRVLRPLGRDLQDRSMEHRVEARRMRAAPVRRHSYPTEHEIVKVRAVKRLDPDSVTVASSRRPRVARSVSMREPSSRTSSRPTLIRSLTSTRKVRQVTAKLPTLHEETPTIVSTAKKIERSSGVLGSIFGGSRAVVPEALVECLTCMSDDIPISKSARLACNHRMCHSCLRRIFTMSVTDPAHMPPTCCTTDHIPLKHVDKLFDLKFKMKWNKKYQEYTTANRTYCPAKGCGDWIRPTNIHVDPSFSSPEPRKYGKCQRCKTKVCVKCNRKWHSSPNCPADSAALEFDTIAKQEGWQRCFNCSAMVELKEGCNHMTCRCRAEFCMICGVKWKSCDCPWFNYAAVENDRLLHMNVAQVRQEGLRVGANGLPMPRAYHEELERRREQEQRDEGMARLMMHRLTLNGVANGAGPAELDGAGAYGAGIFAVGNAAGHFLNEHFVQRATNILTADYGRTQMEAANRLLAEANPPLPATPPRPQVFIRQHSSASRRIPAQGVPGRSFAPETVPLRPPAVGQGQPRPVPQRRRHSALAGLTRLAMNEETTTEGRVDEWRRYIIDDGSEDGV